MTTSLPVDPSRPDRRRVLAAGVAAAGGFALFGSRPGAARASAPVRREDEGPILVVVQLSGGNDGLNTIVPYADDRYHAARKELRVRAEDVLGIDDHRGFHPLLPGLRDVWERGDLAIVEGVGYPHPNRSHFASLDIWHAADARGKNGGHGWLARLAAGLRREDERDACLAVHVGDILPYSLSAPEAAGICFRDPDRYAWSRDEGPICDTAERAGAASAGSMARLSGTFRSARVSSRAIREAVQEYEPRAEYPGSQLSYSLGVCAALVQERVGARILSVELTGFDTHAAQRARHDSLLRQWDGAVSAFLEDLRGTPAGQRTAVLMFSEFGRRVHENASGGTDHGTAAPVFVAGPAVRGGLYGELPSLEPERLDDGDLVFGTDFRSVYATLVQDWMQRDAAALLGAEYPTLPLFA